MRFHPAGPRWPPGWTPRGAGVPDSATVQQPTAAQAPNLAALVRAAARSGPDRPALIWRDRTVPWGELDAQVDSVAAGLAALALPPGGGHPARVAIALPNVPEFAAVLFGVLRAGLIAVPVNPEYTARELRHVLADSGAAALVAIRDAADAVAGVRADLPDLRHTYVLGDADLAALLGPGGPAEAGPPPSRGGEDLAVLLYTSGTEGEPKGAMLPHRALIANHAQLAAVTPAPVGPDDRLLLALPLFHAYGLNSGLGAVAYHGACGVLVERFDPAASLELIERHQVTAVLGVPAMYVAWGLLTEPGDAMASVRVTVCGAAPLEPVAAARFTTATRHPVLVGYGLTETAPVVTSTLASPVPKPNSIGRPLPGVEVRLVNAVGEVIWQEAGDPDPDDATDPDLGLGTPGTDPGEIVVRGANLFAGYWPLGRGGPDPDGWWATGDIAYADTDGDLFLVDRIGELILVNGFNVYPHEVERVLQAHPDVVEAAVVAAPHPFTGQTVRAYVVCRAGSAVPVEDLLRHCAGNLARFKCPTSVEFVAELPHSAIGKVRKTVLHDLGYRPGGAP